RPAVEPRPGQAGVPVDQVGADPAAAAIGVADQVVALRADAAIDVRAAVDGRVISDNRVEQGHTVEQARRKAGPKRGGGRRRRELDEACAVLEPPSDEVLAVHEALQELEARDPLKAQIVLLHYFTGLTMAETATVLGLAERTLDRHWRYIRAWLMKRLSE